MLDRHGPEYALRLNSRQEAREIAQEAYVRLLQLDRQDTTGNFLRAYLYRVATNLAIDRARRRITEARYRQPELFEEFSHVVPGPEGLASSHERLRLVHEFLDELPESVRSAFLMFRIDDMAQEEIAKRLGVTTRMVRHNITRALLYCRLRLDGLSREQVAARLRGSTNRHE